MKYAWIHEHRDSFPIALMCDFLKVSRSGYYDSLDHPVSGRGDCHDNAVAERFFWSLKHEWTKHETYDTLESARLSVFKYIEVFYNRQRLHQSLGYKTPEQYKAENAQAIAA